MKRFFSYMRLQIQVLRLKYHTKAMVIPVVIMRATGNPHGQFSMPLMRFMPSKLATNVGNMSIMEMDVSIFITPLVLLLMILA